VVSKVLNRTHCLFRERKGFLSYHTATSHDDTGILPGEYLMVEFVKIAKDGTLLEIREVPDKYRVQPYDELTEK
jgi:hypothetical protein